MSSKFCNTFFYNDDHLCPTVKKTKHKMKNKNLAIALTGVIAIVSLNVFGQENKKTAEARVAVAEAQKDLREAKVDSAADYKKFRKNAEFKIDENKKKIAVLKTKHIKEDKKVNAKYNEKVLSLEQKNNALQKEIHESRHTKTDMWSSFKREFNHDMDELGQAFKDIGVNNKN
jgi:hypothetical protein